MIGWLSDIFRLCHLVPSHEVEKQSRIQKRNYNCHKCCERQGKILSSSLHIMWLLISVWAKPWQNEETCCQKLLLRTHVSSMFPTQFYGNIVSVSKNVSAVKQKRILLLETMFPVWQNWDTCARNVSGNMFPRLPGLKKQGEGYWGNRLLSQKKRLITTAPS